jgi:hypothetical protein
MTTLTSVLNYGALITLSCCNAVLQVAGSSACKDNAAEAAWLSCAHRQAPVRAQPHWRHATHGVAGPMVVASAVESHGNGVAGQGRTSR